MKNKIKGKFNFLDFLTSQQLQVQFWFFHEHSIAELSGCNVEQIFVCSVKQIIWLWNFENILGLWKLKNLCFIFVQPINFKSKEVFFNEPPGLMLMIKYGMKISIVETSLNWQSCKIVQEVDNFVHSSLKIQNLIRQLLSDLAIFVSSEYLKFYQVNELVCHHLSKKDLNHLKNNLIQNY